MKEIILQILGIFALTTSGIYYGLRWSYRRKIGKSGLWVVLLLGSIGTLIWYLSLFESNPVVLNFIEQSFSRDGIYKDFGIVSFVVVFTMFCYMCSRNIFRESWD